MTNTTDMQSVARTRSHGVAGTEISRKTTGGASAAGGRSASASAHRPHGGEIAALGTNAKLRAAGGMALRDFLDKAKSLVDEYDAWPLPDDGEE